MVDGESERLKEWAVFVTSRFEESHVPQKTQLLIQNALRIWPELIRCSTSSELDSGLIIVAENIKQWILRSDMIEERPSTNELGFITIKLSGKWIAKSIHKMLKDGIDTWAPKLTVKRVWNLRAGSRLDGIRDTYTAAKLEGWIPNDRQKTPRASYVGYRSGVVKLLGYRAEEILDCVYRYTSLVNHRLAVCMFDIKMFDEKALELILEKDEGWEKGEERMLGFHLLEFTEDRSIVETSTLLLYAATDVVMDKCFDLLGISPGVVLEKLCDRSGITLPSSLFESPMTVFRRALLLSTVERPMDLNARDPTRNFWFELFSFRSTPGTPLWMARDWRNPIRINDPWLVYIGNPSSGHTVSFSWFIEICLELYIITDKKNEGYQVGDHKEEIDLSEFWDKKLDGLCGCLSIGGDNGHTRLYYMLLRDAKDTALEIKFTTKTDDCYMALLFRPEPPYVLTDGIIPLIKFVLAVPTKGSLIVNTYMEDAKSDKVIMDGCCKFKPLLEYGCINGGTITGSD
ncbi:hypothetical protein Tco_0274005 [Tanacetum coccineum]